MSEFNGFCRTSKATIKKVAATVPLYEFSKTAGSRIVGADLDGNGKVDLISYRGAQSLSHYEKIKNAGDLKNGLWEPVGSSITRQELIALREECANGDAHIVSNGLWFGGSLMSMIGGGFLMLGAVSTPVIVIGLVIVCGGALAGIMNGANASRLDANASEKITGIMQRKAMGLAALL